MGYPQGRTGLVVLLLLALALPAQAATELVKAWPYISDAPTITVAWDASEGATHYQVKMISKYPTQEWSQIVAASPAAFSRPRVGFYTFGVRACSEPTCTVAPISEWTYSDGAGSVITGANGEFITQPWMLYWRLSAPIPR